MASTRTRFLVFSAALALSASIAGPVLAQDAEPVPFPDDAKPYIPIVSKGFQHQFWQAVKKGAEDEGAALNADVNFIGPASESDVAIQIDMLRAELKRHNIALLCAEEDPLDCHRGLMITPALGPLSVSPLHIRGDGRLESTPEMEERLFAETGVGDGMLDGLFAAAMSAEERAELLAEAYRARSGKKAYKKSTEGE